MDECYKFREAEDSIENLELSENEIKNISKLGLTPDDLQKLLSGPHLAEGSYALIFELPNNNQEIIAKFWKDSKHASERAKRENATLRLLRMRDSKEAPHLMGFLKSANILFEGKIEGNHIDNFDKIAISQLVETMAKIHSIELNAYGKPLSRRKKGTQIDCLDDGIETLRKSLSSLKNPPEIISLIDQAINKAENKAKEKQDAFQDAKFTLIHFDLNRNNILRSNNKIIIIDWEQASAGDNAMDIAKLFLKLNFNEEQKKEFLIEYMGKLSKRDKYFQDRMNIYKPLVLINSILWRLRALNNLSKLESSEAEKKFYIKVKSGFDCEINDLKFFLSSPKKNNF